MEHLQAAGAAAVDCKSKHASHSCTAVACKALIKLKRLHGALQACCRCSLAHVLALLSSLPISRSMQLCRPSLQLVQP